MISGTVTFPILFALPLLSTYVLLVAALGFLLARENLRVTFRKSQRKQRDRSQRNSNREKFPVNNGRFFPSNGQSSNGTVATCRMSPDKHLETGQRSAAAST